MYKSTTLHYACRVGNVEMVQYLLQHVDVNSQDTEGFTPLYEAILGNHIDVFNLLIKSNADISLYKDESALHLIAGLRPKVSTEMLDKGESDLHCISGPRPTDIKEMLDYAIKYFDVNLQADDGCTPLHKATENGCIDNVKYLLRCNCDVNVKDNEGRSALMLAIRNGYCHETKKIIEVLLEAEAEIDPKIFLDGGGKIFEWDIMKLLLKHGVDVNYFESPSDMTVLHLAAWLGHTDLVKFLVEECKADITLRNYNNRTALNFAAFGNFLDILNILLTAGADPNIVDKEDKSPLLHSCREGLYEIVDTLLKFNADIHIRNKHGGTPLHVSSYHNQLDIVKLLVKYNADVNAKDNYGNIAFDDASLQRNVKVMSFLLDAGSVIQHRHIRNFETEEVLEKHVTKLKAADIYFDRDLTARFAPKAGSSFYEECTKEIDLLKSDGPGDQSKFSFFDVLKKHPGSVEFYLKPPEIANCTKWHQLDSRFPIYGDMVYCKYLKAMNGIKLRNNKRR